MEGIPGPLKLLRKVRLQVPHPTRVEHGLLFLLRVREVEKSIECVRFDGLGWPHSKIGQSYKSELCDQDGLFNDR